MFKFFKFALALAMLTTLQTQTNAPKVYPISAGQTWQHYKGKNYEVIAIGHHTETLEQVVIYKALYTDPTFGENAVWVRPIGMFFETVEHNGKTLPRFTLLS